MIRKRELKNIQWSVLICSLLLSAIGLFVLYSATSNAGFIEFKKQLSWLFISLAFAFIFMNTNYKKIAKISPIFYGISILMLIVVLFGEKINGANSWFVLGSFLFQPGEFSKIFVIIFLSLMITKIQKNSKQEINKLLKLLLIISITMIPTILIILQPDYGTAIAYLIALIMILFVSGINKKYILISLTLIIILLPLLYLFILPEHAKDRIDVYLNPNLDPRGAGYNIIQSKIAIGAGRLFGMGWQNGNQTQLGFLYPKSTDFIFSVIGEELGFITCSAIIIIYVVLIKNAIHIAKTSKDDLGAYIAIGIVRNFYFSYYRKYRNDNRTFTNYRYTTTIY